MRALTLAFALALLPLAGCPKDDSDDTEDTDSDTDTDTETDTEATGDCALNSGWPCSCNQATCDDGSTCVGIQGLGDGTMGFCSVECGECPETGYDAVEQCAIQDQASGSTWCAMICEGDEDCPEDQTCQSLGQASVCYPG